MSAASPSKLKPQDVLSAATPPTVLLISSSDRIRRARFVTALIKKFYPELASSGGATRFRGTSFNSADLAKLKDATASLSLFSKSQLIVLDDAQGLAATVAKELAGFLGSIGLGSTVLILSDALAATHPLLKECRTLAASVELPALADEELLSWCKRELTNAGISQLEPRVPALLVALSEGSADRIASMIEQLALYLDGAPATSAALEALFPAVYQVGDFELIDTLLAGNRAKAELLFARLAAHDKSPFMLIGMLAKIFANYLQIKALSADGASAQQIQQQAGLSPWIVQRGMGIVRNLSLEHLKNAQRALLRVDSQLKNRSVGAEAIFGLLFDALIPAKGRA